MNHINEYRLLTNLVNQNLEKNGQQKIVFETAENISENIFEFPLHKLLSIPSDEDFVYEIYYKILDRMIEEHTKNYFLSLLQHKIMSRKEMIDNLSNSKERKRKKTKLVFDKDESL